MERSLRALIHQFWEKKAVHDLAIAKGGSEEAEREAVKNIARAIKAKLLEYLEEETYTSQEVRVLNTLGAAIYNENDRKWTEFYLDEASDNLKLEQKSVDTYLTEIDMVVGDLRSDTTDSKLISHIKRWTSIIYKLADAMERKYHGEREVRRLEEKLEIYESWKEANAVAEATTREVGITRKAEDAEVES